MKTLKITDEELSQVKTAQACSGMWLPDGAPLGNPQEMVMRLCLKYGVPTFYGLDPNQGIFRNAEGNIFEIPDEE